MIVGAGDRAKRGYPGSGTPRQGRIMP